MPAFQLVNPYIVGDMKKTFNTSSSGEAADEAWGNLSKYITNNIPKFAFTMKRLSDGKLYHFVVKEKVAKNKMVNYSIKELSIKLNQDEESNFNKHIAKLENQLGGKRSKDDSDSESDSDSDSSSESSDEDDLIKRIRYFKNKPLNYLWYSPLIYNKDGTLTSVYLPSFTYPIVPYLELSVSSLIFKNYP